MILDVIIAFIIILAMAFGFREGFFYTLLHMAGWIISIVAAFVLASKFKTFLLGNTDLYGRIHSSLANRFTDAISIDRISATLPTVLKDLIDSLTRQAAEAASTSVANLFFTLIAFLIVMSAIKLILFLLLLLLSKRHNGGARGIIDGILGLLMGFIKGVFAVSVLLAVMIPLTGLFDAALSRTLTGWLDSSYFAGTLYDNNILILIVRDFLV